jgi:quercetin dioxygenase-like cupin family protein
VTERATVRLPGIACTFVIDRADDAGTIADFEIEPGFGSPAQTAPYDKQFEVLDGQLGFTTEYRTERLETGARVVVPAGTVHGFVAGGRRAARLRITTPDATYARLVKELAKLSGEHPWSEIEAAFQRHGHRLVFD